MPRNANHHTPPATSASTTTATMTLGIFDDLRVLDCVGLPNTSEPCIGTSAVDVDAGGGGGTGGDAGGDDGSDDGGGGVVGCDGGGSEGVWGLAVCHALAGTFWVTSADRLVSGLVSELNALAMDGDFCRCTRRRLTAPLDAAASSSSRRLRYSSARICPADNCSSKFCSSSCQPMSQPPSSRPWSHVAILAPSRQPWRRDRDGCA
ncbi:hypothetical protein ALI144C_42790 [Actinosynnema sp. ALI-1.44]|nr:hypothetical protein ALI144C_42790 [Actinosynnema sp. ALI-1.44]